MSVRIVAAIILWLALAAPAIAAPLNPASLASVTSPPDARAPMAATFVDQHGRAVTLAGLGGGRPIILAPVQHNCRNLCGLTLESLAQAVAGQGLRPGRDFALVAFGFDPREHPADAARSADRLGGRDAPGVSALVGSPAAVAAVTRGLGYRYTWIAATGQYAHIAAVAVLTPDGRLSDWLLGLDPSPAALHAALIKAQQGKAAAPADLGSQIHLLCFHYDPATGRYSLAIWRLMRWFGGAATLALAGGIGFGVWRERRRGAAA
ncbi:MAG TPA: SCO family protein [Caulobacteraceae bacterium]